MNGEQDQFLDVVDRDEAERRWEDVAPSGGLDLEHVPLCEALGRVLAAEVVSDVDVPAFDRSNLDGFAVRAVDTFGASEQAACRLSLNDETLATGVVPRGTVAPGTATAIATGAVLPRGADAVVMVEITTPGPASTVLIRKPVAPGQGVCFAGTDIGRGETVLRGGTRLTSRETGVLAAIGLAVVSVARRPVVAIASTGDELIEPGEPARPACLYDSNRTILADAVLELGGKPISLGIMPDDPVAVDAILDAALARGVDLIVLSGGTSKGVGDVSYRVLARRSPGIVVHGVALKPGKPICLGAIGNVPVAILPGFPTSAIFTFHELVAPRLRRMLGLGSRASESVTATLPARVNSERGRTEYVLVHLVEGASGPVAYPMGKGSGSVTAFSRADGFVVVPAAQEHAEAGESVEVWLLGRGLEPADLTVIGSHCIGLDWLLGRLHADGVSSKPLWVGSQGGLDAARRGECDVAGIHLLDPVTGEYNRPLLPRGVALVSGYRREQGVVFRPEDRRFAGGTVLDVVQRALADPLCVMINRNRGSGTRAVIDELLGDARPPGHSIEARTHNAVAAAVAQGRADWGVSIEPVARGYGLGFQPIRAERYDFAIPESRWDRRAVAAFRALLLRDEVRTGLSRMGFEPLAPDH